MGYLLRMSGEMHDWLTDLRDSDPAAARIVAEALTALMTEGGSLGPPLVIAPPHSPRQADLADTLDRSYQRGLEWTQAGRRRVSDAAAVADRLRGQIAELESPPAEADDQHRDQLAGLRQRLAEVTGTKRKLEEHSARQNQQVQAFRTRSEVLKARRTTAQAEVAIPQAFGAVDPKAGEGGQEGQQDREGQGRTDAQEISAAADRLREIEQEMERELRSAPWADDALDFGPAPGPLMELRPSAPDADDIRILFAVEPPGTALLLAVLEGRVALRYDYDEAVSLSSQVLRRVQAGRDPEAAAHAFSDVQSFLDEFFPGTADEVEAGAAALAAGSRARTLAELRGRLGLSQAEVAGRMGVRPQRVEAIERAEPGATEVRTLAGYVEALDGRLEIIADVGGERVVLR